MLPSRSSLCTVKGPRPLASGPCPLILPCLPACGLLDLDVALHGNDAFLFWALTLLLANLLDAIRSTEEEEHSVNVLVACIIPLYQVLSHLCPHLRTRPFVPACTVQITHTTALPRPARPSFITSSLSENHTSVSQPLPVSPFSTCMHLYLGGQSYRIRRSWTGGRKGKP